MVFAVKWAILRKILPAVAVAMILAPAPGRADAKKGAALAQSGDAKTHLPPCAGCHGAHGAGDTSGAGVYPRLAGLSKRYILKQLADFRAGRRKSATMQPIAEAITNSQAEDLADYFSSVQAPSDPGDFPPRLLAAGRRLAVQGRWRDDLPPCETCHGSGGVGVSPEFPYLADQRAQYIETELRKWRLGERRNDPMGLMRNIARRLRPADIQAVAAYFQSLPAPAKQGAAQ